MASTKQDAMAGVFRYYQVSISAQKLPGKLRLDPVAVVYTGPGGHYSELGRTRVLQNQWNPKFPELFFFPADNDAQKAAHIRVDFYNKDVRQDRFLGTTSCQLLHIIQDGGGALPLPFTVAETGAVHGKARVVLHAAESYNKPMSEGSASVRLALELEMTNYYGVAARSFFEVARAGAHAGASWTTVATSATHAIDAQGWCQYPPVESTVRQLALDNPRTGLLVTLYKTRSIGRGKKTLGHFQLSLEDACRAQPGTLLPFTANTKENLLAADVSIEAATNSGGMYNVSLKLVNVRWHAEQVPPPEADGARTGF